MNRCPFLHSIKWRSKNPCFQCYYSPVKCFVLCSLFFYICSPVALSSQVHAGSMRYLVRQKKMMRMNATSYEPVNLWINFEFLIKLEIPLRNYKSKSAVMARWTMRKFWRQCYKLSEKRRLMSGGSVFQEILGNSFNLSSEYLFFGTCFEMHYLGLSRRNAMIVTLN